MHGLFAVSDDMSVRRLSIWFAAICCTLIAAGGCGDSPVLRGPVVGRNGMVVSGHPLASEIGVEILKRGGNAVDAAVAVGFALAVVYPEAGNIGGGGFMLIRKPDGSSFCVDFREVAPRASTSGMYIGREGESVDGPLGAGVPGTVDGFLTALREFGTTRLSDLIQPSIDLAFGGFVIDSSLASYLVEYGQTLSRYPSTKKIFFGGNEPKRAGELLVQEDLGYTLERIRDGGREGFYAGVTASRIVSTMDGSGLIDTTDLASYRSVIRPTLKGTYRGYEIVLPGLPSSGGICLLKAFQLLQPYNLHGEGYHSEKAVHLMAESMKRAFSMRAAWLGDPEFADIPVDRLLAPDEGVAGDFSMNEDVAVPSDSLAGYPGRFREGNETTHYSVIDRDGMAVAVTYTINDLFGSKVVVDGAGFFLNDEMDDFVTVPGSANMYGLVGGEENMVEPGKRPLSSMTPTILVKGGNPVLILGARGGSKIISAVFQTIVNLVDFGMAPAEAISGPRFHHQWKPDTLQFEKGALTPAVIAGLTARGHHLQEIATPIGKIEAIFIDPQSGWYIGVPDPREGGVPVGF